MRKKILYIALLAGSSMMYASCTKIESLISAASVDWTTTDVSFDVPVITNTTDTTAIGSATVTYDLDSLIKAKTSNQLGLANVDEVHLTSCTATILNPDSTNSFANFESVKGSFSTSANGTWATIGQISNNPDVYASTLTIPVDNSINYRTYVSPTGTTSFNYSIQGKGRRGTNKVLHATAHITYSIHVTP